MSIASQITRINNAASTIKTKAINMELGTTSSDHIDDVATDINAITIRSASDVTASGQTVTIPKGYYKSQATKDVATGNYSASCTKSTNGSASMAASNMTTASSGSYYVTLSTTAGTAYGTASITTAGYLPTGSKDTSGSKTSIPVDGNGNKLYIQAGAYSASCSQVSAGSASMAASNMTTASSGSYYVTLSTTAGTAKGTATIGTAGYIPTGSTSSSNTSVSVSGNGNKLYIKAATITSTSVGADSTVTISDGYTPGWTVSGPTSQTKTADLTTSQHNITPDSGKVLSAVIIPAVQTYYYSTSAPTSSDGVNGDIWLKA